MVVNLLLYCSFCRIVGVRVRDVLQTMILNDLTAASRMVRNGYFGFEDYFESLCDSVEVDNDFYLLGADFESYLEAQVIII